MPPNKDWLPETLRSRIDRSPQVTLRELSREFALSERTLRRVFRDAFSVSPGQYQLALRLHLVRARLTEERLESISDIAAGQGFWHMGRFCSQYRRLFGETPSQTRRSYQG